MISTLASKFTCTRPKLFKLATFVVYLRKQFPSAQQIVTLDNLLDKMTWTQVIADYLGVADEGLRLILGQLSGKSLYYKVESPGD